jgi:hypothetical protein
MTLKNKRNTSHREAALELRLAQQAFERLAPSLAAIPADRVEGLHLDLQSVAIVARKVSKLVDRPEVRQRLVALPREVFDPRNLDLLRELSLAAWWARARANLEASQGNEIRVEPDLVKRAREVKHRMIQVLEYFFLNDTRVRGALDAIRGGTGHQTLASDLIELAELYQTHREAIRRDPFWYRETDRELAQSYAGQIVEELTTESADEWPDLVARLWTRLHTVYEEVRLAGTYVFRDGPLADAFPSLHAATRAKPHVAAPPRDG